MRYLPVLLAAWALFGGHLLGQMSVSLTRSVASPAPLGTPVMWTASVSDEAGGTYRYRFRTGMRSIQSANSEGILPHVQTKFSASSAALPTVPLQTAVDYGPSPTFTWTKLQHEGMYQVEVSVENRDTGDTGTATAFFEFTPLAGAEVSTVTPTAHPLVFIYSAPPCLAGSRMRVQFQAAGDRLQQTPSQACDPLHTMNFYIAGVRAGAVYSAGRCSSSMKPATPPR